MLTSYLNQIRGRPFIKNFVVLSGGSIFAQLILFIVLPVITRLYSEEDYGVYSLYNSILMVLVIPATLKYELAIVLPKHDRDGANIVALCLIITTFFSVLLFGFIYLLEDTIQSIWPLGTYIFLIPVSVFFVGIFQTFNFWLNRKKEFAKLAAAKICRSSIMVASQSMFGFLNKLSSGLILGLIAGQVVSSGFIVERSKKRIREFWDEVSLKKMWYLTKTYKKIPLLNTVISILNMVSNQIPVLFFGVYFGADILGNYGLAIRAILVPTSLISLSFGQVFYQRAAEMYKKQPADLYPFVRKVYKTLFLSGLPFFILLGLFAPFLFGLYFGEKWVFAGEFSRLLVPWLFLVFMNSPVSYIVTILGKQQQMVLYDASLLIMRTAGLIAGYWIFGDPWYSVLFYALVGFVFNLYFTIFLIRMAKQNEN